jgi:hypothetical protein
MAISTLKAEYNWHPVVHAEEYEETLYFLLIRLHQPRHRRVSEQIRRVLETAGIEFACEYSIFGYWDALVRAWLTHDSYLRLMRVLKRRTESNVAKFETFVASEMRYLWAGTSTELLNGDQKAFDALARCRREVRATVDNPDAASEHDLTRLQEEGLIISREVNEPVVAEPDVGPATIKFYIALQRIGGDLDPDEESSMVLRAVEECGLTSFTSIYGGTSRFAAYLIRCVVPTYSDVLEASAELDIHLAGTRLRTMTLLVANTDARESDQVNQKKPLTRRAENTLRLLALQDEPASTFANLTQRDWDSLNELVERAHEIGSTDQVLLLWLIDIYRACVKDNQDELARAVAFITDTEFFVAEYMVFAWSDVIGDHWFSALRRAFNGTAGYERHAAEMDRNKDEDWTAGSYAHLAVGTVEVDEPYSELFDARLRRQLMPDWKQRIMAYAKLRNGPAHGKLRRVEHLDAFRVDELRALLLELMDIAAFCSRIRRAAEEKNPECTQLDTNDAEGVE